MVYVVEKDEHGQSEALYRFNIAEAQAEYLTIKGGWVSDEGLWSILDDLHNPFYEEITASQAQQVASDLGALTNKTTLQPLAA